MKRKAFVTGAARGIGAAIAESFRRAGFEVLAPTRAELDLAEPDSVRGYLKRQRRLSVDVLVNNAGENRIALIADAALKDWQRMLTVNLTSAFLLTQAFSPGMAARKWGRIVNMSSCYGLVSRPGRAAYSATKAGLLGLTRAAALELGGSNVLVNAVCPGFVDTEMTRRNNSGKQLEALRRQTALKRLASPREIAELVLFLGSEANTYITGQALVVDGGFSCQ